MARPLEGSLEERARRAAREEMALHLADAVRGRLDLGTAGRAPAGQTDVVARVLAAELGWDAARMSAETAALAATYGPLARADVDRMSGDSREAG
jgi:glycerol-3-phosphate dehydrogenase